MNFKTKSFSFTLLQAYVFKRSSTECAAFLENSEKHTVTVQFQNIPYQLPPKSISILPDCKTVAFNTAQVKIKCSIYAVICFKTSILCIKYQRYTNITMLIKGISYFMLLQVSTQNTRAMKSQFQLNSARKWKVYKEAIPSFDDTSLRANTLLDQISTAKDTSDYMWYTFR